MENVSENIMEKIKTHFVFNNSPPPPVILPFMKKCGKM
jgi:hypothetical protein